MRMNPNLYPPDGYIFTEVDGVKFRGDSWRDLFRQIKAYREGHGQTTSLEIIEQDVFNQHCAKTPGLCHSDAPAPPQQRSGNTLNARVLNWFSIKLAELRQNGSLNKVSDAVAKHRAGICAKCPRQTAFSTACEACISAVESGRKSILGGKPSVHQGLHPCSALGEDCVTTIHLDLPPTKEKDVPPACWRVHADS